MIKALTEFLKNVFAIYGIAILVSHTIFYFFLEQLSLPPNYLRQITIRTYFPHQVFVAVFFVTLLRLYTDKFDFKYPILERLLDWALITVVITACWWLFGWRNHMSFPFVPLSTAIIYIIAWVTLVYATRRDIASINEKIRQRKAKRDKNHEESDVMF